MEVAWLYCATLMRRTTLSSRNVFCSLRYICNVFREPAQHDSFVRHRWERGSYRSIAGATRYAVRLCCPCDVVADRENAQARPVTTLAVTGPVSFEGRSDSTVSWTSGKRRMSRRNKVVSHHSRLCRWLHLQSHEQSDCQPIYHISQVRWNAVADTVCQHPIRMG